MVTRGSEGGGGGGVHGAVERTAGGETVCVCAYDEIMEALPNPPSSASRVASTSDMVAKGVWKVLKLLGRQSFQ